MNHNRSEPATQTADTTAVQALRKYEHTNDITDLDAAITAARTALASDPTFRGPTHEKRVKLLSIALYFRYTREGNPTDIGEIEALTLR